MQMLPLVLLAACNIRCSRNIVFEYYINIGWREYGTESQPQLYTCKGIYLKLLVWSLVKQSITVWEVLKFGK